MHNKSDMLSQLRAEVEQLNNDEKASLLAFIQIIKGEIPADPLAVLRLNRDAIKMQEKGCQLPAGLMPMLAGLALNIIDGVNDLTDRRVLMSYYWHAEDVQSKKVPDVLKKNGFFPA